LLQLQSELSKLY